MSKVGDQTQITKLNRPGLLNYLDIYLSKPDHLDSPLRSVWPPYLLLISMAALALGAAALNTGAVVGTAIYLQ